MAIFVLAQEVYGPPKVHRVVKPLRLLTTRCLGGAVPRCHLVLSPVLFPPDCVCCGERERERGGEEKGERERKEGRRREREGVERGGGDEGGEEKGGGERERERVREREGKKLER